MKAISPKRAYPTATIVVVLLFGAEPALGGASCSVAATGVSFGAYDRSLATPNDSTGDVTVTCTYVPPGGATGLNIQASLGPGVSGSYSPRQMAFGSARLNYNLYRDTARNLIWGNGLSGTGIATASFTVGPGVGNGTRSVLFPVYGRVPALQVVGMGAYSDTIVVTVTF